MITQQIDIVRGDILIVKFRIQYKTPDSKFVFECRPKFQTETMQIDGEIVNDDFVVTFMPEFSIAQKWSIGEYRIIHEYNGIRDVIATGDINIVIDANHSPNYHQNRVSVPTSPTELIPVSITTTSTEIPDIAAIFILNLN